MMKIFIMDRPEGKSTNQLVVDNYIMCMWYVCVCTRVCEKEGAERVVVCYTAWWHKLKIVCANEH